MNRYQKSILLSLSIHIILISIIFIYLFYFRKEIKSIKEERVAIKFYTKNIKKREEKKISKDTSLKQIKNISKNKVKKTVKNKIKKKYVKKNRHKKVDKIDISKKIIKKINNIKKIEKKDENNITKVKKEVKNYIKDNIFKEEKSILKKKKTNLKTYNQSYIDKNIFIIQQLIKDNLYYPRRARKRGIEGKVIVKFKVLKDSSITDIEIISSKHNILSRSATKTISSISNMIPNPKETIIIKVPIEYRLR